MKPPPKDLLASRPCLAEEAYVLHPETSPSIGEPPKRYSKAAHERIVLELEKGQRPQGACARAGIPMSVYYEWMRKGRAGDPWLVQFVEDVDIAQGIADQVKGQHYDY